MKRTADGLTTREMVVLRMLTTHQTYVQIAHELFVSPNTIKSHVARVYEKLGVHDRAGAVAHARELGILPVAADVRSAVETTMSVSPDVSAELSSDPVWMRAVEGARRAHERALVRLRRALARARSVDAITGLIARDVATLVGAAYSNLALIDGPMLRIAHHEFLDEEIALRYMTVPFDDSTPLGTAARTGEPVVLASLNSYAPRYAHMIDDTAAAGVVATISYPVPGHGAIGVAWTHESQIVLDRAMSTLADVSQMCADALANISGSSQRSMPTETQIASRSSGTPRSQRRHSA